jgi:predicted ATP-grasp superfamily ATP-dependent carboligase
MLRHHDEIAQRFTFCLPPGSLVDALNDKAEETRLISSLGIPLPKTVQVLPASARDLQEMIALPIIIKPRSFRHVPRLGRKNLVLHTAADVQAFYDSHGAARDVFIAQEVIPGPDDTLWLCSATFNHRHELVQGAVKYKLRMVPPHFGVSSFAVSASNPAILELVAALGAKLGYVGHMAAEFKWDHRDGLYKYIELNPRIPGSVALDDACDAPTVWNTYRVSLGEDVEPVTRSQRDGVVYVQPLEDIYHRLKDGESPGAISRHYLTWALHKRVGSYFVWNDPVPALLYTWRFFRRPILRRLRRWRGEVGANG